MSPTGDTAWAHYAQHVPECLTRTQLRLRRNLIATVRTAVRLFEPFLDAVIAEDVLALRETQWCFVDTLRADNTEVIVADHASYGNNPSVNCRASTWGKMNDVLRSFSASALTSMLSRDDMALLEATLLLDSWPRSSWCALILSSSRSPALTEKCSIIRNGSWLSSSPSCTYRLMDLLQDLMEK